MAAASAPRLSCGALARDLLRAASGLDVSEAAAERAVRERLIGRGHLPGAALQDVAEAYLANLTPAELAALIELVVVPESWLFRDPDAFAAATAFVQRRLQQAPERPLRILSLPCAGGEEPYTMAMALLDAGVPASSCRIDAIDLSQVALTRARTGWFSRNAFRGADLAFRERHFVPAGAGYQISEALRGQVNFSQGNILTIDCATQAGRYDVIFCRNLLIYFDAPTSAAAVGVLRALLADDGMLLAGYAEVPTFCANGFHALRLPGAFALQKNPAPVALTPPAPTPARAPVRAPAPRLVQPRAADPTPPPAPTAANAAQMLADAQRLADGGDYPGAASICRRLLQLDAGAETADAYYLLGLIADLEHQPDAAAGHWRRCVYLRPDHYEALCQLAILAERTGQDDAASLRQRAARVYQRRQSGADTP